MSLCCSSEITVFISGSVVEVAGKSVPGDLRFIVLARTDKWTVFRSLAGVDVVHRLIIAIGSLLYRTTGCE